MLGIHRLAPIGHIVRGAHSKAVFVQQHELTVVAAKPRILILRLKNPLLRCIIIAGHAPHTGADAQVILAWWSELAALLPAKFSAWPKILLVDANARVGAEPCECIGEHQAEPFDPKSEGFVQFLNTHGLWVPATFADFHHGLGATWRHTRGHWFRNDFVCLPKDWKFTDCRSWVSMDIDVGLAKEDHRAAVVRLTRQLQPISSAYRTRNEKLALDLTNLPSFNQIDRPAWDIDVHSHFASLQSSLIDVCWDHRIRPKCRPRKVTMSDHSWLLVQEKRECRNLLHDRSQVQKFTLLEAWFMCWKHATLNCPFDSVGDG